MTTKERNKQLHCDIKVSTAFGNHDPEQWYTAYCAAMIGQGRTAEVAISALLAVIENRFPGYELIVDL